MSSLAAADAERQGWQLIKVKVFTAEGLTIEQKAAAWKQLIQQDLPKVELLLDVGSEELPAVLRNEIPAPAAAQAPGGSIAGPRYLYRCLVKQIRPIWPVAAGSSTTHRRRLQGAQLVRWSLQNQVGDIMGYVQQQCGELQDFELPYRGTPDLRGEAMCNIEFHIAFAAPAARMVSKMRPGLTLTSNVNPPGNPLRGLPDFVFTNCHGCRPEEILVGEGKTPSVMRSTSTIFLEGNVGEQLRKCIEQEVDYMFRWERRYGFLTYLNGTMFIRRTGDLTFAVTDAVTPDRGDPTVLEMLTYILLKQYDEGAWKLQDPRLREQLPKPTEEVKEPTKSSREQQQQPGQQPAGGSSNNNRRPGTRRSARQNRDYVNHYESDIAVFDECLGHGQSGVVLAGRVHGKDVALKAADLHKQTVLVEQLEDEIDVLEHLASLQGGPVPELVEYGFVQGMEVFFVATSIIRGEHPGSSTRAALPAAQEALAAIHSKGVLHGDIRAENVLVSQEEGVWRARFIDFGSSTFGTDPSRQADEMRELELLFRYSEDSTMTGASVDT